MGVTYIFDLPVYRLSEDRYYAQMNAYIDDALYPPEDPTSEERQERDQEHPDHSAILRQHMRDAYGGMWRYNEIIGYIRLHFLGTQIRGEYYAVAKRRIVKTRRKQLDYRTWKLAPEREVPDGADSHQIFEVIRSYLADCKREVPRRYIDTEMLETVGPYVDWRRLYIDS